MAKMERGGGGFKILPHRQPGAPRYRGNRPGIPPQAHTVPTRIPPVKDLPLWLRHATVWLLLALTLYLLIAAWERHERATQFRADGSTLEIRRGADGHYHWPGSVNGRSVDFLIDTGATRTALPAPLARSLDLPTQGSVRSSTAAGVVTGTVVLGDLQLQGGVDVQRLRMTALEGLSKPLLGMDVLGRLGLQQRDGVLRIELPDSARP